MASGFTAPELWHLGLELEAPLPIPREDHHCWRRGQKQRGTRMLSYVENHVTQANLFKSNLEQKIRIDQCQIPVFNFHNL